MCRHSQVAETGDGAGGYEMRGSKSLIATLTVIVLLPIGLSGMTAAAVSSASVVPPDSVVDGQTYAQWSAAQWAWEIQAPTSPTNDQVIEPNAGTAVDPAPVNCALRQTGDVWFLAGTTFFENYTT